VLAQAGLVATRREGNSIFYRRAALQSQGPLQALCDQLLQTVDTLTLPADILERLAVTRRKRALQSQEFFEAHAREFAEQQELIAEFEVYSQPVAEFMKSLPAKRHNTVLEIGPGAGSFLPFLSQQFQQVTALDNSAEMLNQAREALAEHDNIRFVLGDSSDAIAQGIKVQNIVMNMVLHHVPSPAELFNDSAALLEDGGYLVVADLCDHDQDWVRKSCGDLWLGFHADELSEWAEDAGLQEAVAGQYHSLRNGFRVQIRIFQKSLDSN
jgi:ArsR family transcriptional regulator